ncbi:hypothetical protein [Dysgonomonas sp. 25]|uniref:hypothetical protein n=1 Tax=Dysgonomonas sp. 25 TaxID=2302933 RepID=UPI0013D530E0|nr:hypothetical protein [Dysgonomonas sp. 25]NDV67351.1 hypothetical protein [Dysgonomonas sp. 25]
MKKSIYIILLLAGILIPSCSDNDPDYVIPATPVSFRINLSTTDNHLNSPGNVGIYIPKNKMFEYNQSLNGVTIAKVYGTPRAGGANEYYGYSGVLIFNTGIQTSSSGLVAYDLCCSYEQQVETRVVPTNDYRAKCPKCNSVFNLYEDGKAMSGPATTKGKKLQLYRVFTSANNEFYIRN